MNFRRDSYDGNMDPHDLKGMNLYECKGDP